MTLGISGVLIQCLFLAKPVRAGTATVSYFVEKAHKRSGTEDPFCLLADLWQPAHVCRLPAANGREKASLKPLSESKHVVSNLTVCASDSYFELTQRLLVGSKNLPERHLADKV